MTHSNTTPKGVGQTDELRGPITHDVKCWPEPFKAVKARLKPWELRLNDRDYRVGDTLRQREWDPATEDYTGDIDEQDIAWALYGPAFGLPENYVIMTLATPTTGTADTTADALTADLLAAVRGLKTAFGDPMTRRALGGHNERQQEAILAASAAIAKATGEQR